MPTQPRAEEWSSGSGSGTPRTPPMPKRGEAPTPGSERTQGRSGGKEAIEAAAKRLGLGPPKPRPSLLITKDTHSTERSAKIVADTTEKQDKGEAMNAAKSLQGLANVMPTRNNITGNAAAKSAASTGPRSELVKMQIPGFTKEIFGFYHPKLSEMT